MRTIFAFLFFTSVLYAKPLEINVCAESAILLNGETGAVLFEKNSRAQHYPASLTKIATALYTLNKRGGKLDVKVTAEHDSIASISEEEMKRSNYTLPAYWLSPGASHIGIKKGEELPLKALLYGMMVASAGDASNVIACHVSGTIPVFMEEINRYLKEIGCQDTVFKNPHGLHHPGHKTTAWDLAHMTQIAMQDPLFCEIVKTVTYKRPDTNKQKSTPLLQTNKLLRKGKFYYDKAIGVKTGYTSQAQNTVVAAAQEGDRKLIAVLLKCEDRDEMFADATKLFKTAFNEKKVKKTVLKAGIQKSALKLKGGQKPITAYLKEDLCLEFYPSEETPVKCLLHWNEVSLPVAKDQQVAILTFEDSQGKIIKKEPLFAAETVEYNIWNKAANVFKNSSLLKYLGMGFAFLLFLFVLFRIIPK